MLQNRGLLVRQVVLLGHLITMRDCNHGRLRFGLFRDLLFLLVSIGLSI